MNILCYNVNGEDQMRQGLLWIPRHPVIKKGVASNGMFEGAENKHRLEDF